MTKPSLLVGGLAALALAIAPSQSRAADHLDSPSFLETGANPMADINDVYTWMTTDAKSINLIMTVSPGDPGTRSFSDAVQYVFHVVSRPGAAPANVVGMSGGTETKVICSFASNTSVQCWVVQGNTVKDYVTGNPSVTTGVSSSSGKTKVFAGRRSDPFFFNLQGFRDAIKAVKNAHLPPGDFNAAGCPNLAPGVAKQLRDDLSTERSTDTAEKFQCPDKKFDCFETLNVMGIVVQLDKTLINSGANTFVGVWASTHAKP